MSLLRRNAAALLLLLLGAAFVLIGVARGEPDVVFSKAINL
ncbi:MAG: CD1871A family CXXC motif-containing protein, partial [Oscillospiraceae bacterium]